MSSESDFNPDASPSLLGYIYQVNYALFMCLEKLRSVDEAYDYNISIEKLDDVGIDKKDEAITVGQVKFHDPSKPNKKVGNLTDKSSDLWGTLRIWVKLIKEGNAELGKTDFVLITTQTCTKYSIADYLNETSNRIVCKEIDSAHKNMLSICNDSPSQANKKGCEAFQSLKKAEQKVLLRSIYIITESEDIDVINSKISNLCRQYVSSDSKKEAFADSITGTWLKLTIEALKKDPTGVINLGTIQAHLDKLKGDYRDDNLPAEFMNGFPVTIDVDNDPRNFVKQLRLLKLPNQRSLKTAIIDYFRSMEQRTKWSVDGLLNPGELDNYDDRLIEKWGSLQSAIDDIECPSTDEEKRKAAIKLYHQCRTDGAISIRSGFLEEYVATGSYQMLSDDLKIGWLPDYQKSLEHLNDEDAA